MQQSTYIKCNVTKVLFNHYASAYDGWQSTYDQFHHCKPMVVLCMFRHLHNKRKGNSSLSYKLNIVLDGHDLHSFFYEYTYASIHHLLTAVAQ
jgi:hypothetical protein